MSGPRLIAAILHCAGPKELPVIARAAGRATGQAAAFLSRSRTKLLQLGKDAEIAEVDPGV